MNLLDPTRLLVGVAVTAIPFAVIALFTRAALRRMVGVLIDVTPIIPLVMIYNTFAAQMGWWHYLDFLIGRVPLAWYTAAALGCGAAFGLIGWCVIRRWTQPGLIIFYRRFCIVRRGAWLHLLRDHPDHCLRPRPAAVVSRPFSYASAALIMHY